MSLLRHIILMAFIPPTSSAVSSVCSQTAVLRTLLTHTIVSSRVAAMHSRHSNIQCTHLYRSMMAVGATFVLLAAMLQWSAGIA